MGKVSSTHTSDLGKLYQTAFFGAKAGCEMAVELLHTNLSALNLRANHDFDGYKTLTEATHIAFAAGQQPSAHQTDFLSFFKEKSQTLAARTPHEALAWAEGKLNEIDTMPPVAARIFCQAMGDCAHSFLKADQLHKNGSAANIPDQALAFYTRLLETPRVHELKQAEGISGKLLDLTSHIHRLPDLRKEALKALARIQTPRVRPQPSPTFDGLAHNQNKPSSPAATTPRVELVGPSAAHAALFSPRPSVLPQGLRPVTTLGKAGQDSALVAMGFA